VSKRQSYVCILPDPDEPLTLRGSCKNIQQHTPCPESYLGWHAWAEKQSKTHTQLKCPACGRYEIWAPNRKRGKDHK
jgi:hypothetical protein